MNNDNGSDKFSWLDDKKWAPWKVTLGVVLFCGMFWMTVPVGGYYFCMWAADYITDALALIRR